MIYILLCILFLDFSGCRQSNNQQAEDEDLYIYSRSRTGNFIFLKDGMLHLEAKGTKLTSKSSFHWEISPIPQILFENNKAILSIPDFPEGQYEISLMVRVGKDQYKDMVTVQIRRETLVKMPPYVIVAPDTEYTFSATFAQDEDFLYKWSISPQEGIVILSTTSHTLRINAKQQGKYNVVLHVTFREKEEVIVSSKLFVTQKLVPILIIPNLAEPNTTVIFDAHYSRDPYQRDLHFLWAIYLEKKIIKTIDTQKAEIEYQFPKSGVYTVSLTIKVYRKDSNLFVYQASTEKTIQINTRPNPVIDRKGEVYLTINSKIEVSALESSDKEGDSLSYHWFSWPSDALWISHPDSIKTSIKLRRAEKVKLFLGVTDTNWKKNDFAMLHILPNRPPQTNSEGNLIVRTGGSLILNGAHSFDPDGDELLYSWKLKENKYARIKRAKSPNPLFEASRAGEYKVVFSVSDGLVKSPDNTFTVRVGNYWFVDNTVSGGGDGKSWKQAFRSISDAIAVAKEGDAIWVAEGIYYPTAPDYYFKLARGVSLYGGFSRTETYQYQRNIYAHPTVLSGDIDRNDVSSDKGSSITIKGSNSTHVIYGDEKVDSNTILDGFFISGGYARENKDLNGLSGGGMLLRGASPILRNLIFDMNVALDAGGALYIERGNPMIANVKFIRNTAARGGGYFNLLGGGDMSQIVFARNVATRGGAIYLEKSHVTLVNSYLEANTAYVGGGVMVVDSNITLVNVTVFRNRLRFGHWKGRGMIVVGDSRVYVINSIFWDTLLGKKEDATDIIFIDHGTVFYKNSLIRGSGGSGVFWDTRIGNDGGGNLDEDPKFLCTYKEELVPFCAVDKDSPVRNAGDSEAGRDITDIDQDGNFIEPFPYDIHNNQRVIGTSIDIGAEEIQY